MDFWGVLGGCVAAAFGLARLSLNQQRSSFDRLMNFLERNLGAQESHQQRIFDALEELRRHQQEANLLLNRMVEYGTREFHQIEHEEAS
ncbi:MAG: hypothetical protein JST40_10275 [Armatimonadetes bacterium]|nr:hypothetical protein [Armatimonadota bacterium]